MEDKTRLSFQIDALDSELANIYRQKILCEAKVEDAKVSVGDEEVDKSLRSAASLAGQTLLAQNRQIDVRVKMVADLQAEREALMKAQPAP